MDYGLDIDTIYENEIIKFPFFDHRQPNFHFSKFPHEEGKKAIFYFIVKSLTLIFCISAQNRR